MEDRTGLATLASIGVAATAVSTQRASAGDRRRIGVLSAGRKVHENLPSRSDPRRTDTISSATFRAWTSTSADACTARGSGRIQTAFASSDWGSTNVASCSTPRRPVVSRVGYIRPGRHRPSRPRRAARWPTSSVLAYCGSRPTDSGCSRVTTIASSRASAASTQWCDRPGGRSSARRSSASTEPSSRPAGGSAGSSTWRRPPRLRFRGALTAPTVIRDRRGPSRCGALALTRDRNPRRADAGRSAAQPFRFLPSTSSGSGVNGSGGFPQMAQRRLEILNRPPRFRELLARSSRLGSNRRIAAHILPKDCRTSDSPIRAEIPGKFAISCWK